MRLYLKSTASVFDNIFISMHRSMTSGESHVFLFV